ncbi:hypothetical protein QJS04_geneDACA008827 [Acorus gramineus]|uniref:Protein SCAI n=1 Tax=Acorus gramineus TaxID=55184 RepID=A0AAV9AEP5_ACOGR|nr:hypothetical protein QJS04_geneDACA008827 [Acorus gramineus]
MGPPNLPPYEIYWNLVKKADKNFITFKQLPICGSNLQKHYFQKALDPYTKLWKFQKDCRSELVEAGVKRWEVGDIASRIAQIYHENYERSSDPRSLNDSFLFFEAILTREYFKGGLSTSHSLDLVLVKKQMRFLARFLIVCLLLNRRVFVDDLYKRLRSQLDECKLFFPQDTDFKEYEQLVREINRFLRADTPFMNMRSLRYTPVLDSRPDSEEYIASLEAGAEKGLRLHGAILSSYHHNEVKFTEFTLDTFRMRQCLEWEPSGSFYRVSTGGPDVPGIVGSNLPANSRNIVLYRRSSAQFLAVLATVCEDLPSDGILLVYLSAGKSSEASTIPAAHVPGNIQSLSIIADMSLDSPIRSRNGSDAPVPHSSSRNVDDQDFGNGRGLWLGAGGNGDRDCIYPSDLIPFTRWPFFLIVDSDVSDMFKAVQRTENGKITVILLSPRPPLPSVHGVDFARTRSGSQFTMFLTAPLQAFCSLLGISSQNIDRDMYNEAEDHLSLSMNEWGRNLAVPGSLGPVWTEVLGDPFLRRIVLRFLFCRAVIALYTPTSNIEEYIPQCLPPLPDSVLPRSPTSQSAVRRLADFFGVVHSFSFS